MGDAGEAHAGNFGQDAGAGPEANTGHQGHDLVKRVGLHEASTRLPSSSRRRWSASSCFCQFQQHDTAAVAPTATTVCSPRAVTAHAMPANTGWSRTAAGAWWRRPVSISPGRRAADSFA